MSGLAPVGKCPGCKGNKALPHKSLKDGDTRICAGCRKVEAQLRNSNKPLKDVGMQALEKVQW